MKPNTVHGGDLDEISRLYNIPKENLVNLAGNVNPLGMPESVIKVIQENASMGSVYPDISYKNLISAISEYTSVKQENLMVGNGSTELISHVIKGVAPKKALVVSPAYSEYVKELNNLNCEIELFPLLEEDGFFVNLEKLKLALKDDVSMLIFCNPNNPTGTYLTIKEVSNLLDHCKEKNIYVMIDETYVEFSSLDKEVSSMPLVSSYTNLFVIRGTSKFFACPGIRLGYMATSNKEIKEKILIEKDPWSVNIYAAIAGEVMFLDKAFVLETRKLINEEKSRLESELKKIKGIKLFESQANFFLLKLNESITSEEVFKYMLKHNLLIRDCGNFPFLNNSYIRFCIQKKEINTSFLTHLKNLLTK